MNAHYFFLILLLVCFSSLLEAQGDFTYTEKRGVETLDPITYMSNPVNDRLATLLYSSLFSFDNEPKPVPDMVEKIDSVPSRLNTYILTLRKGMKWADGQEVTADDVIRTVEIIRNPKTQCNADTYLPLRISKIRTIERVNKYSLRITFWVNYSASEWQSRLHFPIMPKKALGNPDGMTKRNTLASNPNGCGPFYFKQMSGDNVVMKKNPEYHRTGIINAKPIREIQMFSSPDDVARTEYLLGGRATMLIDVPWGDIPKIYGQASQFELKPYESLSYNYLGFNFRNVILQLPVVRQAIAKAINREKILSNIYFSQGNIINGPFPPASPYCDMNVPFEPYDPDNAKKMILGAGMTEDKDGMLEFHGKPVTFRLTYQSEKGSEGDAYSKVCEYIAGDLREAGILITLDPQPASKYIDMLFVNHDFDISFGRWRFGDIEGDPSTMFVAKDAASNGNNYIGYHNDDIEVLFNKFQIASDDNSRKELGREIHGKLAKDHPYVFLWSLNNQTAYNRKKLSNVSINPFSFFDSICEWQSLTK